MTHLTGSQDLLSYFNLIPIYNKVVKANQGIELDPSLAKYISDLPGRLDIDYDGYLFNLLRDPQAVESGPSIKTLDAETLRDAFSLKEGPIPGFDASVLGTDDNSVGTHTMDPTITDIDYNGERKHKKKKKKRKHDHDHDEDRHGDHKKKKKKKRDKEKREENESFI